MEIKKKSKDNQNISDKMSPNIHSTVEICSYILENIIKFSNEKETAKHVTVFDSEIYRKQSITDYIKRIVQYCEIDENVLILTMMNFDKLMFKNHNFSINKSNCYKIFFASLLETNKLYDDFVIPKSFLCKVALINADELIGLEAEFLQKLEYNLYIEENDFLVYKNKLNNLQQRVQVELETKLKAEREFKEKQSKLRFGDY